MADDAAAAAADVVNDLIGVDAAPEATTDTVVEQTAPEPQPEVNIPSWDADTDGIEDLLNEPEPEFELEDPHDDDPVIVTDEYTDPETAKLKAQLEKARKEAQYFRELRAKDNLKGWRAEAQRRFPLADADEIDATSRRAVLRKAQEQHERYARKIEPVLSTLEELKASIVTEAKTEAKEQAAQSWGKPTAGPQPQMVATAEEDAALDRRNFRNLQDRLQALVRAGKLEI